MLWISVFITVFVGIFLRIPFFKSLLKSSGVDENELLIVLFSFVILSLSLIMFKISKKSDILINKIDESKLDFDDKLFFEGTDGIYKQVNREMSVRKLIDKTVTVDIIGYTLFSVAPKLKVWKRAGILNNMTLNLCHLNSEYIKKSQDISDS